MTGSILPFFIVCPLTFLGGLVDAMAGGGGLISLPAYLIAGLPAHMAIGTNKLSSGMGTTLATLRFAKSGYIQWGRGLLCALCAVVGSSSGARLALLLGDTVLPLTALYVLRARSLDQVRPPLSWGKTTAIAMVVALVLGVYDGFYGPGTGTFLILLLTALAHLSLTDANGTAKVINLTTNLSALAVFLFHGKVLLPLGLAAGCFSILGNYLGTRFFDQGGSRVVKPVMLGVLGIFFLKVLSDLL